MDPILILASVVFVVLAIIFSIVGIYMTMVLIEFKETLSRINRTLEGLENQLLNPLEKLGGLMGGIQTGVRAAESVADWMIKKRDGQKSTKSKN